MIKTKNVTKIYTGHEVETVALDRVNIEINTGEFIGFLGPSGSGKTSLVNILGLLSRPTRGEYYFMDTEVSQLNSKQLTAARRGQIGFISKHFELIDELTVKENVELPLLYLKTPASERGNRVKEALERMNIGHKRNHYPQQLSDVQQQRAAIARAFVVKPAVIIADEPTGKLDSINSEEIMRMLMHLNEEGAAIILATQSLRAAKYAHRVVNLYDGKIVAENNLNEQFHL